MIWFLKEIQIFITLIYRGITEGLVRAVGRSGAHTRSVEIDGGTIYLNAVSLVIKGIV